MDFWSKCVLSTRASSDIMYNSNNNNMTVLKRQFQRPPVRVELLDTSVGQRCLFQYRYRLVFVDIVSRYIDTSMKIFTFYVIFHCNYSFRVVSTNLVMSCRLETIRAREQLFSRIQENQSSSVQCVLSWYNSIIKFVGTYRKLVAVKPA